MKHSGCTYLMYHEIERAGRAIAVDQRQYMRYVVTESVFRRHLETIRSLGVDTWSVSQAQSVDHRNSGVVITFDDGCESDNVIAAPLLVEAGMQATFYVCSGFLGRPGYMTPWQLRELHTAGFEIGAHGVTHSYLSELSESEIERELHESKDALEQILGAQVLHLSCPGGRWSETVARYAMISGYHSVATSMIGVNKPGTSSYRLRRNVIVRDTRLGSFTAMCRGDRQWGRGLIELARLGARSLAGSNKGNERFRTTVLTSTSSHPVHYDKPGSGTTNGTAG